MSPERINNIPTLDEIDFSPKYYLQLGVHGKPSIKVSLGLWLKNNQHIDIAFGAKVLSNNRTEQREFLDLPAAAEISEEFNRYGKGCRHR